VGGALAALSTAANCRRWEEVDILLSALSAPGAYPAASALPGFEALHPELCEAMRRAHIEQQMAAAAL